MIAELKPYPEMKDSGVSWLGLVPSHWIVAPNRANFSEVRKKDEPDETMLSVTIARGVIRQEGLLAETSKKDSSRLDRSNYKLVLAGDIVYNKMRAWQGAVGMAKERGIVSPAYVVQRPGQNVASQYMHYLLRTPSFAKEAERWSYGITSDMWCLRPEHFRMIYSCLPPLPEQEAICRFLDYADRRIRRYIRAKQKLIKLLEEQKQATIHRAVTRGLNPDVRLKPSGVEWLGDIPEHWEVRKLGVCVSIVGGMTPSMASPTYWNGRIPWVSPKDMKRRSIDDSLMHVTQAALNETSLRLIEPGSILIVVRGMILSRHVPIAITTGPVTINQDMKALRPTAEVDGRFLLSTLESASSALNPLIDEAGHGTKRLPSSRLKELSVGLPPIQEQYSIVNYVEREISIRQCLLERSRNQITLLQEYRTRLISDVVTGKLDVRQAAANLPTDAEEDDALELDEESQEEEEVEDLEGVGV